MDDDHIQYHRRITQPPSTAVGFTPKPHRTRSRQTVIEPHIILVGHLYKVWIRRKNYTILQSGFTSLPSARAFRDTALSTAPPIDKRRGKLSNLG